MAGFEQSFLGNERFQVKQRLGAGGMGVVYRAHDTELGAEVALKTLRALDATAIYRFKREFRALADLSHPNLVSLHELVSSGDRWFFTMELVEGVDFLTWVRGDGEGGGRLDERRLRAAMLQLAEGVHTLHQHGCFHRDIKPSNVLVTREGRVVLLDFGLVTMFAEESADPENLTTHIVGTIGYMAPEQAAGMPATAASDWYSVGVILFESLTGARPFGGTPFEVLAAKQRSDPPAPSEVVPGVPQDLDQLAVTLLCRDPRRRPSGEVILAALGAAELPLPPGARGASTRRPLGRARSSRDLGPGLPGRTGHLEALHDALGDAEEARRPIVVSVHGASGLGKTSLVRRFLDDLDEDTRPLVLLGRCFERESVPFKAFDACIDALTRHLLKLPHASARRLIPRDILALARVFPVLWRVRAIREAPGGPGAGGVPGASPATPDSRGSRGAPPDGGDLEATIPAEVTAEVEEVTVADPHGAPALAPDPRDERRLAFDALATLLSHVAGARPIVIHVDDVQWSDLDSAALLAHLLRSGGGTAMLVILSYRTEDRATSAPLEAMLGQAAASGAELRDLEVGPLAQGDARLLARWLLEEEGHAPRSEGVVEALARESGGSPLFLGELVRHARRPGGEGALERTGAVSLDDVLDLRLDRLSRPARELLELVCVSGRPIAKVTVLDAALDGAEAEPEGEGPGADRRAGSGREGAQALVLLLAEHLLKTRLLGEGDALEVFHDRIRQRVLRRLDPTTLADRHRRLALALERAGRFDPEALLEHLAGSGDLRAAARWALPAAKQATAALAFDRAARLCRLAIELSLPGDPGLSGLNRLLGEALAAAGRGREAAEAHLLASEGASPALGLELRRVAAEQLLRSGHVDRGLGVLEAVLAEVGMALAPTPGRAVASLLLRRAQVRVRGLRFTPREEAAIEPELLAKTDILWSVAMGLAMVDTARGSDFQARHLLLALRCGERYRLARAMAMEACYSATAGSSAEGRTAELLGEAEKLARELGHPHALGLARYATGVAAFLEGRFSAARVATAEAEQLFRERCTGVAWEIASARVFHLWSSILLGRLAEGARLVRENLREALDRGDLYAAANLRGGLGNLTWLLAADPAEAERQLDETMSGWSQRGFHIQHYYDLVARAGIDLYRGQGRRAYERVTSRWPELAGALLLRVQFVRTDAHALRARAALAAAIEGGDDAAALLTEAERDAARVERERTPWSAVLSALLSAGVAAERGEGERAIAEYRRAEEVCVRAEASLHRAAASWRLGELLQGTEGARRVAEARAWLEGQGAADAGGLVAMLAPARTVARG